MATILNNVNMLDIGVIEYELGNNKDPKEILSQLKTVNHKVTSIFNVALGYMNDEQLCQLIAIDEQLIRKIVNPTEEMQYIALRQDHYLSQYIENISEYNAIYAIGKGYSKYSTFSSLNKQCHTVNLIKYMWKECKSELCLDDIFSPLLSEPKLKDIVDELKLKQLGNM